MKLLNISCNWMKTIPKSNGKFPSLIFAPPSRVTQMCNLLRDFTSFLNLFAIYSKRKGGHVWWRHGTQSVTSRSRQLTQKIIFCPPRPVVTDVIPFTTVITEFKLRGLSTICWYHCGEKQSVYCLMIRLFAKFFSPPQRPNRLSSEFWFQFWLIL